MGFLSKLFGGDATKKAGKENAIDLNALMTRGMGYIDNGERKSAGYLTESGNLFNPWIKGGVDANNMYGNAIGLGGAGGSEAARKAFRTNPGYEFQVDEAMRGAERGAAAGGMLASGNLLAELQTRGQNLADQEYGGWLDRLMGRSNQGLQAASGKAGALTNLANLYQGTTGQRLGLDASVVGGLNANRNNMAQAEENGVNNMWGLASKFLGFLKPPVGA